ncbi:MAG: DUF4352 domain-containing protein [Minisyncoccia bacterium]
MKHIKSRVFFTEPKISIAIFLVAMVTAISITWYCATVVPYQKRLASMGVAPMGTEITAPVASLRVESVREDTEGALPYVPRKGYTFIIPTITVGNLTKERFHLFPELTLYLKDKEGNVYNTTMAPLEGGANLFSEPILPQDKVRQEVAFEVKSGAKGLVLYFDASNTILAERLER